MQNDIYFNGGFAALNKLSHIICGDLTHCIYSLPCSHKYVAKDMTHSKLKLMIFTQ